MVAQMAQFSSLAGIEGINSTLKGIAAQLDQVMAAQTAAAPAPAAASTSDPAANPATA